MEPKRYPRTEAIAVAKVICDALKPSCSQLIVAGSLRRRKPTVKDVEILYVSNTVDVMDGLFDIKKHPAADQAIIELCGTGVIKPRTNVKGSMMWGEKNKLAVHIATGINIDLFAATDENWFNYLVCRTGGAENNVEICNAAIARGWKWNPYGSGFTHESGEQHTVTSERDVFEFVGLPYLEPWER